MTWSTSDVSVASVSDGVVTANKIGTATITARAGNKTATCAITVEPTPVTSVTLDKTSASLKVGGSVVLTATVNPSDATDKTVTWSTSDVSVASVSDGVVTANMIGTATITARAGNKTATCAITVEATPVTSVTLDKTTASLKAGETVTLIATVKPDDATDKTVSWTTSDASVATVTNGVVVAVKVGTATITARAGNRTATCAITVEATPVTSVTLSRLEATLEVGETVTLDATVSPDNATDKTVTWSSSDASVATVSNGIVVAKEIGAAKITARAGDKSATCMITVIPTPVTSVTLDKTSASLKVGEKVLLTATVGPRDATDKTVTWSSSDPSVATVSDGLVTAVKVGPATITAQAGNVSATCAINVCIPGGHEGSGEEVFETPVESITLDKTITTLRAGESVTLTATVKPDGATDNTVTWSTSNDSVASVSNGIVTAKKIGSATITAKAGDMTATCAITVEDIINAITCQVSPVYHPSIQDDSVPSVSLKKDDLVTIVHQGVSYKYRVNKSGQVSSLSPDSGETKLLICKEGDVVYAVSPGREVNENRIPYDNYNAFSFSQPYDLKNEELPLQVFRGEGIIQNGKLSLSFTLMYSYLRIDLGKDVRNSVLPKSETIRVLGSGLFGDGEYDIVSNSFYWGGGMGASYIYDYSGNSASLKNQETLSFYFPIIPISADDYSLSIFNTYGSTIAVIQLERFVSQSNCITRIDVSSKDITIGDGDFNNPPIVTW